MGQGGHPVSVDMGRERRVLAQHMLEHCQAEPKHAWAGSPTKKPALGAALLSDPPIKTVGLFAPLSWSLCLQSRGFPITVPWPQSKDMFLTYDSQFADRK